MSPGRHPRYEVDGRRRDAAFLLPVLCALILLPPFVNLFVREVLIWGVPLDMVYLFGIWIVLVIGAMVLSRGPVEPEARAPRSADEARRGRGEAAPRGGTET